MASKHREQKAIAAVACPVCHAPIGAACRNPDGTPRLAYGRPLICSDRRLAWQLIREGEIKDEP